MFQLSCTQPKSTTWFQHGVFVFFNFIQLQYRNRPLGTEYRAASGHH